MAKRKLLTRRDFIKAAGVGAGTMGAQIAAHLVNVGVPVTLSKPLPLTVSVLAPIAVAAGGDGRRLAAFVLVLRI